MATAATIAVLETPVLGIPAMRTLAMRALVQEEKSWRGVVSKEVVQEERVTCGVV